MRAIIRASSAASGVFLTAMRYLAAIALRPSVNSSNPADLAGERLKLNPAMIEAAKRRMYSLVACR